MGTEIHSKTYFPVYSTMRDLTNNVDNGMWTLYHEDQTLKNGRYYDSLLTGPTIDGYLGYDKEHVRQTILKHESIFKHQLRELHHLYRRQRDLMDDLGRRELHKHPMPAETSKSCLFLSHLPSADSEKTCHASSFPLVDSTFGRLSSLGTGSVQSPLIFMEGTGKSTCSPFPSHDRVCVKDCEPLKSKGSMCHRKMFDLELPADVYMNNEAKQQQERICGASGVESYSRNSNHKVLCDRDVNLSPSSGLNSDCNGYALRSNLCRKRTHDLADLNEPIHVEETSNSASVNNLGITSCLEEDIQRRDVSVNSNSGLQFLSKKFCQNSLVGSDGGIFLINKHLESERNGKEQLNYNLKAGLTRYDDHACPGGICPERASTRFKTLQVEPCEANDSLTFSPSDRSKTELRRKRTIFGVEISEGNPGRSACTSHTPSLHPLGPQSDVINSESSSVSPWRKTSSTLGQNVVSVQENPCLNTFDPSIGNPNSLMQLPVFLGGKTHVNSNSRLIPSSKPEVSYQNGLCLGSQSDGKQLQDFRSSISFDFPIGINAKNSVTKQFMQLGPTESFKGSDSVDFKSANNFDRCVATPPLLKNEVVPQQNSVSVDGQRKHENPVRGLPWLIAKPHCSGEQIKGREEFYQMSLDSLQNYSQHFFNKAEMTKGPSQILIHDSTSPTCVHESQCRKIEIGDCHISRKIHVFPIVDVPHVFKDVISPSSPSKSSRHISNADGDDTRKDIAHDPESGNQLEVKDVVIENGLNNYISGLRHQIDLNLSLNEEEAPSAPSLPRAIVKIATTEIDLEAPSILESEMDNSPEAASLEKQFKMPSKLSTDDSSKLHEELSRVAAEAIIAISLSGFHKVDASCQSLEASPSDCLLWFAEVISYYKGSSRESKVSDVCMGDSCDEESIPEGMDYFEFMTLKLKDMKEEEYCCKPLILEHQKDDEMRATSLPKRPRKGQARRGRQRKDFQRDILPGLVSLSRHEVTEDLQTIEDLFSASGCTWQSSLSQRRTGKTKRGRRRSGDSAPSLTAAAVCPPIIQQSIHKEPVLEERRLTGWGKRTRRLPRHRCPTGNQTLALKC